MARKAMLLHRDYLTCPALLCCRGFNWAACWGNNGLSREPWGSPAAHLPSLMTVLWCHHISVSPGKDRRKLAKKKKKVKKKKKNTFMMLLPWKQGIHCPWNTNTLTQSLTRTEKKTSNIRLLLLYWAFCYFPTFWCTKNIYCEQDITNMDKYSLFFKFIIEHWVTP